MDHYDESQSSIFVWRGVVGLSSRFVSVGCLSRDQTTERKRMVAGMSVIQPPNGSGSAVVGIRMRLVEALNVPTTESIIETSFFCSSSLFCLACFFFFASACRLLLATRSLWQAMQYIPWLVFAKTSSSIFLEQERQVKHAAWYDSSPAKCYIWICMETGWHGILTSHNSLI